MIVLDTNVLSELMAPHPSPVVRGWLDGQNPDDIWTTSITIYEIVLGIERLQRGKKRELLHAVFFQALAWPLERRVLPFAFEAAQTAATFAVQRRHAGRPISLADSQIAGIAAANSATLVTRNLRDFSGLGLSLINPWEACA